MKPNFCMWTGGRSWGGDSWGKEAGNQVQWGTYEAEWCLDLPAWSGSTASPEGNKSGSLNGVKESETNF